MKVFAHRGYSGLYPENTILAFKKAIEVNVCGVEIDVHKTKDGKIVVIHDELVNRTHNGFGFVKDFTYDELQKFQNKDEKYKNNEDCKIPLLEDVLKLFLDNKLFINIELKNNIIDYENLEKDVINLIKDYNLQNRVIISSFKNSSVEKIKKIDKNIEVSIINDFKFIDEFPPINIVQYSLKENLDGIHLNKKSVDYKLVENCKDNNKKIRVYTVNEKEDLKEMIKLDVDAIFTDFPKKVLDMI